MITLLTPVVVPVLGALGYAVFGWRRSTVWLSAASAAVVLAAAIMIAVDVVRSGAAVAGLLRADALSAFMLVVIGAVALLATVASPAYLQAEIAASRATTRTAARHSVLVQLFLAAMALAVLAANLGVVWVAIEATTIVTAFLVGQRRTRPAVEAAWKYVVICSAGIALALLGTIVLNFAASHAPGRAGLDLAALAANASGLDPGVTKIAVLLLILGFGTKAGLAPLHAWLPDAHSQAPAPVSALMSGVLLSVAFYAILRVKMIADGALGIGFIRTLLAGMAVVSLAVAASLLVAQRDYKRMLAYPASSTSVWSRWAPRSAARSPWPRCSCTFSATGWPKRRCSWGLGGFSRSPAPVGSTACGAWPRTTRCWPAESGSASWLSSGCRRSVCSPANWA
ncbi:proton-conducting membrane transporter [Actinocrispum wychmicini]|uniref:Proton-conducting membrane transporter n=1 Tax=Actinocrispum wychmicini TaxID=1213861 RepID=A0A4R2JSN8_9PSEU|nr:proton-conducting membrane transporter [Actinocrispum wychmicini]